MALPNLSGPPLATLRRRGISASDVWTGGIIRTRWYHREPACPSTLRGVFEEKGGCRSVHKSLHHTDPGPEERRSLVRIPHSQSSLAIDFRTERIFAQFPFLHNIDS